MFVISYQTRAEAADRNQQLVEQVFAQLRDEAPEGVRYLTLRLADGSFVHIASFDGADTPLTSLSAFAKFQADLGERIASPPTRTEATVVGSYGFGE
ncbi:MAG: hypothetical protein QOE53_2156 [Pseudonocardiales bacterium]|jgi:glutathione S-transferase|nr:hypothetical protein [Pseudonocardiales bacterium]